MSVQKVVKDNGWVLGYTLRRKMDYETPAAWESARRQKYLLNPEIPHVLSFDDTVWPLCDSERNIDAFFVGPVSNGLEGGESCEYIAELFTLHEDQRPLPENCLLVAVVGPCSRHILECPGSVAEKGFRSIRDELDRTWRFLGFDAVEAYLGISGLSNTGYSENDLVTLRSRYAHLINEFGLLPDLVSALSFAAERTTQVREHAPFLPVALFVLEK